MLDTVLHAAAARAAPVWTTARVAAPAAPTQPAGELCELLAALLDEVDTGVILCTGEGRLLLANFAARQELESGATLHVDAGRLQAPGAPAFSQHLRAAARLQRRQLMVLGQQRSRLLVYALPMALSFDGRDCCALMLGRRRNGGELAIELLAGLFGLTSSERQVLLALAAGQRVSSIAQARGVAVSTVRTQVMAIRGKTDAPSICAVLGLVAQMPPITSALRGRGSRLPAALAALHGADRAVA